MSPIEPYGIPALLSLLFPGLGQLVKLQTGRAVMIWVGIILPAAVATWALNSPQLHERPFLIALFIVLSAAALYLFALVVWLWGVVDAYNRPVP